MKRSTEAQKMHKVKIPRQILSDDPYQILFNPQPTQPTPPTQPTQQEEKGTMTQRKLNKKYPGALELSPEEIRQRHMKRYTTRKNSTPLSTIENEPFRADSATMGSEYFSSNKEALQANKQALKGNYKKALEDTGQLII